MLVTHDRYLLDRVSTVVLGLDGEGGAARFADYRQWEEWQSGVRKRTASTSNISSVKTQNQGATAPQKKKLSYLESREYAAIEERVAEAEELLQSKRAALEDPAIVSNAAELVAAHSALEDAQREVDALYARWAELEAKRA